MKIFPLVIIVALLCLAANPLRAADGWGTDYDKALARAKAEKKIVLLDFSGSDWCPDCIRLERGVFSQLKFQEYAKKNLVLVDIDFPHNTEQPAALKKQNSDLLAKYRIFSYPTIVVLDSDGKQIGELGYEPTPEAFLAKLERLKGN
ncbi:MAG TPA: thioredoxin family protein [Chthoniobacteraceae bacterium]|nr:thioredoxin family protein [Chthoniobacteraceae bacterium]